MVTFRVDLGKDGQVSWETEAEDLVDISSDPRMREYVENELGRIIRVLLGSMRSPDTERALEEFANLVTDYARKRIARIRQLGQN